jgi:hypothetical protein
VPDELAEEVLKRPPYVSEGIRNPRLLPEGSRVAFELRPGFETQASLVASRITEVAGKLAIRPKLLELSSRFWNELGMAYEKLAVGSINYHQDFFGRAFGIETNEGPAHTRCLAFGWERLALAFLARHGLDSKTCPEAPQRGVSV